MIRLLRRAHPRSRGENGGAARRIDSDGGSSPLTRGKPGHIRGSRCCAGLIPAHAGKTEAQRRDERARRAHPRSRGENIFSSSLNVNVGWLIPAHAGKTMGDLSELRKAPAHPRSRGENALLGAAVGIGGGSSPLTRGKHCHSRARLSSLGLIPAHAGKTAARGFLDAEPGAHPRSRGENCTAARCCARPPGSSPLTRGKLVGARRESTPGGLIPAHAGKTSRMRAPTTFTAAHPRSRGENARRRVELLSVMGSSPLTRGKPPPLRPGCPERGLIPAHAGKTRTRGSAHPSTGAHPRSRGENMSTAQVPGTYAGSSPLTRGKH